MQKWEFIFCTKCYQPMSSHLKLAYLNKEEEEAINPPFTDGEDILQTAYQYLTNHYDCIPQIKLDSTYYIPTYYIFLKYIQKYLFLTISSGSPLLIFSCAFGSSPRSFLMMWPMQSRLSDSDDADFNDILNAMQYSAMTNPRLVKKTSKYYFQYMMQVYMYILYYEMILRIKCALMATRPKALTNLLFRESGCSRFLLAPQMPHALGLLCKREE